MLLLVSGYICEAPNLMWRKEMADCVASLSASQSMQKRRSYSREDNLRIVKFISKTEETSTIMQEVWVKQLYSWKVD